MLFDPRRVYAPSHDMRAASDLEEQLASGLHGNVRLLVARRRSGKTWALRGVEHALNSRSAGTARWVDLRSDPLPRPPCPRVLLLDEPAPKLTKPEHAKRFVRECRALRSSGHYVTIACTPVEVEMIRAHAGSLLDEKDVVVLAAPTDEEIERLASRADWAKILAHDEAVPAGWRGSPFLLELLLASAETRVDRATLEVETLLSAAVLTATNEHSYVIDVYERGLTERHKQVLRQIAGWPHPLGSTTDDLRLLEQLGVVGRGADDRVVIADPILAAHLPPPLRIHHVSDVHVGDKSAMRVDAKASGSLGATLAAGAGQGPVRETYIAHLEALPERRRPQLLVLSGDLAERGTPSELTEAASWVANARSLLVNHPALAADEPRVLLVGGNHDVDWTQASDGDARSRHVPFADAFAGFPHPRLELPVSERPTPVFTYPDAELEVLLLGSAEFGGERERSAAWELVRTELDSTRRKLTDPGVDAADAASLVDKLTATDPGLVHHQVLEQARAYRWRDKSVRIAVVHHPLSAMPGTEIAPYSGLINAGDVKQALLDVGCCLVLHGHLHRSGFLCEEWADTRPGWVLRIGAAGSLGSREAVEYSFQEIELLREGSDVHLLVRRYVRQGDTWQPQASFGPFRPGER